MTIAQQIARKRLKEISTQKQKEPTFRGAARLLQTCDSADFEIIIAGPAETGKTFAALWFVHSFLLRYPGSQGLLTRQTQKSIYLSVLRTYKKLIAPFKNILPYGGAKPEWYQYPNNSQLHIVGLDNDEKILSTEFDIIYVNQTEGIALTTWETLTTRATGRAGNAPTTFVIGDCNPGPQTHWILQRKEIKLLYSQHRDNPTLYDDLGHITAQGQRTLDILNKLTGIRKLRLAEGKWTSVEGAVYAEFDINVHVIPAFTIPVQWARYRVIDFGFTNPFVCHWFAVDNDGRLYLYRELYRTQLLVEDAAPQIIDLSEDEYIAETIADHDAEDRATLHKHGIQTIAAKKAVKLGIEAVEMRLRIQDDGKPRLYILDDCLVEVDENLVEKHLPTSVIQEFDGYVWDSKKELPMKADDHGLDCIRYMVAALDNIGKELERVSTVYVDDSHLVQISEY